MRIANVLMLCVALFMNSIGESQAQTSIENVVVYYQDGRYAGWPANHGIWMWGNEILVGFVESKHKDQEGHTYDRDIPQDKYARSLDGGNTWEIEDALNNGQTTRRFNHKILQEKSAEPIQLHDPVNFKNKDLALVLLRQTNNIGPSHYYYSYNRGNSWKGAFKLPNFGTPGVATRTDYLVDGKRELTAFLTAAKGNGKEGRVMCVRTSDGGLSWKKVSWIGEEPEKFEIMPSSVRLSKNKILTTIRRREENGKSLISSYVSMDNGRSWKRIINPVEDTGQGGSPPALVRLKNKKLALGYIVRKTDGSRVCVKFSSDEGQSWGKEYVLREDGANRDVGYPRMIQRNDGKLVIVYYWNHALREDKTPFRFIAATIFDPKEFGKN